MVTSVDKSFSRKGNKSSNKEKALSQFLTRMKARQNFDFKISFFFFGKGQCSKLYVRERVHLILFFTQSCM